MTTHHKCWVNYNFFLSCSLSPYSRTWYLTSTYYDFYGSTDIACFCMSHYIFWYIKYVCAHVLDRHMHFLLLYRCLCYLLYIAYQTPYDTIYYYICLVFYVQYKQIVDYAVVSKQTIRSPRVSLALLGREWMYFAPRALLLVSILIFHHCSSVTRCALTSAESPPTRGARTFLLSKMAE